MKNKTLKTILAGILIAFISLPLIDRVLPLSDLIFPGIAAIERKNGIPRPRLNKESLKHFTRLFNNYYARSFGFRNELLHLNFLLHARLLGASPHEDAIIGRNNWLYYAKDTENDFSDTKAPIGLLDYRGLAAFTPGELSSIRRTIERRYAALSRINKNVYFIVIVAPNKNTIYPEYLPIGFERFGSMTRLDQIAAMEFSTGISIVDARKNLIAAKSIGRLYYKTDTHWNDRGAFIACEELKRGVRARHPRIRWDDVGSYGLSTGKRADPGDIEQILGMDIFDDYFVDTDIRLAPKNPRAIRIHQRDPKEFYGLRIDQKLVPQMEEYESPDLSLPRMVMFYDSFGTFLIKFLAGNFSHSLYLWTHSVDENINALERERPDIVIHQVAERFLDVLCKGN